LCVVFLLPLQASADEAYIVPHNIPELYDNADMKLYVMTKYDDLAIKLHDIADKSNGKVSIGPLVDRGTNGGVVANTFK